ncbi:CBS domain-containing protein [Lentzea sp. BCCO 10_0856]|uniref:CBS domain-containing protein n=1 Tax=Lentzea miocenica TaxID=3095431 RepID=A0ABU4T9V0_9PSEU|nr:CBS domain-containing protein [Lentzea sp. BCCO 10_0856]MDX8034953.1 CBS domain-containing protein [Lentzea sp. BCCO 10_0856]
MRAREFMTSPAITVTPEVPVRGAAALLVSHGFTALPVVDDDKRLVGIVTEADLLRNGYVDEASGKTVGEVMTSPAVAMDADAQGSVIARVLVDDHIRCLPIVDGSQVVGVVTRRDLVRVLARTDTTVAAEAQRVLDMYGGGHKWTVVVRDGEAVVGAENADEEAQRVLTALAASVVGVLRVRVLTGGER